MTWLYEKTETHWRPNIAAAMAEITGGLYGEEYEDRHQELVELVDAVRREWAEKLRKHELQDVLGRHFYTGVGIDFAADLLDPDKEDPK